MKQTNDRLETFINKWGREYGYDIEFVLTNIFVVYLNFVNNVILESISHWLNLEIISSDSLNHSSKIGILFVMSINSASKYNCLNSKFKIKTFKNF
jgi:hypothetical protein